MQDPTTTTLLTREQLRLKLNELGYPRGDFPPIATPMDIQRVAEALASLSKAIQAQYNVRCGAVIFEPS